MEFNQREKRLVLFVAICVGAFVADWFVVTPLFGLWSERSGRIAELKESIAKGELLVDREEIINSRWADMRARSLPDNESDSESRVLGSISRWTAASGLDLSSVKPRWPRPADTHKTLQVKAVGEGNLDSIVRFLYSIEQDPAALRVDKVEITARDESGSRLLLEVDLIGLILTEQRR